MAYTFDGVNDSVVLPASALYNFNNNVLMCAIVNVVTLQNQMLAVWGATGLRGYGLSMADVNGNLNFVKVSIVDVTGTATTALATGTWYAVMAHSLTGGNAIFRRLNLATGAMASETVTDTDTLVAPAGDPGQLGIWLDGAAVPFDGRVAGVGLWNRAAFSEDEFRAWVYRGFFWGATRPVALYPLLNAPVDWSGNGLNGTLSGAVVGDHAPLAPYCADAGWAFAAAGGGLSIPVAMHHYAQMAGR